MMRQLNFHHLRYFWLVATSGNLTQVAAQLNVSQSSLSLQIRQLEESLGQSLFKREHRRLALTPFGSMILHYAQEIFEMGEELVRAVEGQSNQSKLRLRVGSVSTLSRNFQEQFLHPLMAEQGVHLVLESGGMEELLDRLLSFQLDVVLSNRPVSSKDVSDWRCQRIARQPISLVGKPTRRLASMRFPKDIHLLPLLLPGSSSDIRTQLDALFDRWQVEPTVVAEVDDMAMLRLLARDGIGFATVPRVVVKDELQAGKLVLLCDLPDIVESFYAISVKRVRGNPVLTMLLQKIHREKNL